MEPLALPCQPQKRLRRRGQADIFIKDQIKGSLLFQSLNFKVPDLASKVSVAHHRLGYDGNAQAAAHHLFDGRHIAHPGDHIHIFKDLHAVHQRLFHLRLGPGTVLPHDKGLMDKAVGGNFRAVRQIGKFRVIGSDEDHAVMEHRLIAQAGISPVSGKSQLSPLIHQILIDDPAVRLLHVEPHLRIHPVKLLHQRRKIMLSGNRGGLDLQDPLRRLAVPLDGVDRPLPGI